MDKACKNITHLIKSHLISEKGGEILISKIKNRRSDIIGIGQEVNDLLKKRLDALNRLEGDPFLEKKKEEIKILYEKIENSSEILWGSLLQFPKIDFEPKNEI